MARCSCGNATCSCIIQGAEDGGIAVIGSGSPTRPYLLSLEDTGKPLNNLVFDDTPSLNLSTSGSGTSTDKLHVSGVATPKMTELRDVNDPTPPVNGDVPTWVTDHWEFRAPAGGGGGAATVFTGGSIAGDGSPGSPVRPGNGVEIPAAIDLNTYTTPGEYIQTQTADTTAGSNYPTAQSGLLEVFSNGSSLVFQRYTVYNNVVTTSTGGFVYERSSYNGVWSTWQIIGGQQALPAPIETYVSADQTIVNTARPGETPTQVRASMTNPHPTKRMLVDIFSQGWVLVTGASAVISLYYEYMTISGTLATARTVYTSREDSLVGAVTGATFYKSMFSSGLGWIDAAATVVLGISITRGATGGGTVVSRYNRNTITPIRYE